VPVYQLIPEAVFPPVELAEEGGLLAVGGDLRPERLLLAYSMGIFPWFNDPDPILWWSPDPRFILEFDALHVSRSLAKLLRSERFSVTFDQAFVEVLAACGDVRRQAEGTWITPAMACAYERLHELGYAHSVEVWLDGQLAGGLYGVCLGRCFFGESMFHRATNASKVALVALVERLKARDFELLDCQMPSDHLRSLGGREIARDEFLRRLRRGGVMPSTHPLPGDFA